jgi:diguanylate cyclase (GGDEF)-like protein
MTWSLQLTFWALPPLLAVLVVLEDLGYLLPHRREPGTRTLIALVAASGAWAAMDLVAVVSPSLEVKRTLALLSYLPAAAAAIALPWFALVYTGRKELPRWPMLVLYVIGLATVGVVLTSRQAWIFREPHLVPLGGVVGLQVSPTLGFWVFQGAQLFSVAMAVSILSAHSTQTVATHRRLSFAGFAGALAVAPSMYHLVVTYGREWADLSSSGYALGASLLAWGFLRPRLLDLGPVDRNRVLHELHDPIVVMDAKGRIVDVNRAAESDLGLRPYGDVPVELGTIWAAGLPDARGPARVKLEFPGAQVRHFEVTLTPLGDHGTAERSALLLRDITAREQMGLALERANADLKLLANTDPLTGLANRRRFMEALDQEMERAQRYARPLSLVLLDLDYFKKVNDTHGHAAGDDVLRSAAKVLRSVCRDLDLAARLGGEELALLLPETDAAGAGTVAERVRRRMETTAHLSPMGETFSVTASIGVASLRMGTDSGEVLLRTADEALYRAKRGGRNRVVMSGGRGGP